MQAVGYVIDKASGEKIKILVRQGKYGRYLKKRENGSDGNHFADEEYHLNEPEQVNKLNDLKNGSVVYC
jgi:hypothetical protein